MTLKKSILATLIIVLNFCSILEANTKVVATSNEPQIKKYIKDLESLSNEQLRVMLEVWTIGEKENLGYILTTIAWKESNFGKWKINLSDGEYGSYGVFHIRLDYTLKRNSIQGAWNRDRCADKLLSDLTYSSQEAISLIKYWQMHHSKNKQQNLLLLKSTFASYNGGFKYKSQQAQAYGDDAILRLLALQRYFKRYALEEKLLEPTVIASN